MAIYAIGDVQGCYSTLQNLLKQFRFRSDSDRLWFVGDLVNRGPQSLEVLRFIYGLGANATIVIGNHDIHLLRVACGAGKAQNSDTLAQVYSAPDATILLSWLRKQPLAHFEDGYLMVHAGLYPQWDIKKALQLSEEVQLALSGPQYTSVLKKIWGSTPDLWDDNLSGVKRLRFIVNAMTRMRYIDKDGRLELCAPETKGTLNAAPPGCKPWFEIERSWKHTIICGHWAALGLHIDKYLLAIDTGCCWGRALTAVRLEDRSIFQQSY